MQHNILECRIYSKHNINAYGCTYLIEQIGNNSRNVHSAKWWIIIDLLFRLRDILAKADRIKALQIQHHSFLEIFL